MITTSRFTKAATNEAEMTDRAPVTLINGELLVELLAEFEIGVERQSRPVLQLDETTLAGATATDGGTNVDCTTAASPAARRRRGCTGVSGHCPAGTRHTWARSRSCCRSLPTSRPAREFITRLQREFPQVESIATANGYIRVLVALGFIELSSGRDQPDAHRP